MSHNRGSSAGRWRRPAWLVVSLIFSWAAVPPAMAAPIRHTVRPDSDEMQVLHDYLVKGPHYWAHHPAPTIPRGIAVLNRDGSLKSDLFVDYLHWRWQKDPSLFDHRHPRVGTILTAVAAAGKGDASTVEKALAMPASHSIKADVVKPHAAGLKAHFTIHAEPQLITGPTTVPEPSSLLLAAGLAGAAVWWRRRRHAQAG